MKLGIMDGIKLFLTRRDGSKTEINTEARELEIEKKEIPNNNNHSFSFNKEYSGTLKIDYIDPMISAEFKYGLLDWRYKEVERLDNIRRRTKKNRVKKKLTNRMMKFIDKY